MNKKLKVFVPAAFILLLLAVVAVPSHRKARQTAQLNACANNLRMIHSAIVQTALANRYFRGDHIPVQEFTQYMKGNTLPVCSSGGVYLIPDVFGYPSCSVHGDMGIFQGSPGELELAIPTRPTGEVSID